MKTVKLNKKLLTLHPADLLLKLGAANLALKQAYPDLVFFSKEDYKLLKSNLTKSLRKQYPGISAKKLATGVNYELLNFGPNESIADGVRPGYALIDTNTIELLQKSSK